MAEKIPVAVLGATGSVGQRFVQMLSAHPWFRVAALTGSGRSSGMAYAEACHWVLEVPMPEAVREMVLTPSEPELLGVKLAFSALPAKAATEVESTLAGSGLMICSNASAYRDADDVAILLPEVNPEHVAILDVQRRKRGWRGGIVTNSNCTITGVSIVLKALQEAFGVQRVFAVSMQALSGAGYPGVASLDIVDNVIPYIPGEEEKVESEPLKILGSFAGERIIPASFKISAHTNRVAVSDGHMVCLTLELGKKVSPEEAAQVLREFSMADIVRDLPSSPKPPILVREEADRPQPRLDRMAGDGMTTVVGRLRPDPICDLRIVVLSHNTIRGAAGGSIFNAELLVSQGWVEGVSVPHA